MSILSHEMLLFYESELIYETFTHKNIVILFVYEHKGW